MGFEAETTFLFFFFQFAKFFVFIVNWYFNDFNQWSRLAMRKKSSFVILKGFMDIWKLFILSFRLNRFSSPARQLEFILKFLA